MKTVNMAQRIELWPLDRLKPYDKNARTHDAAQVTKIAASIVEFGFTNPILVDQHSGIIAGHGRLEAARKLKLEMVPIIELTHLDDLQRRAYILADNRLALDAGWDNEMLAGELADLGESGFDLGLTGFEEREIEALLDGPEEPPEEGGGGEGGDSGRDPGSVTIDFDNLDQREGWFTFTKWLGSVYTGQDSSLAARLHEFIRQTMRESGEAL